MKSQLVPHGAYKFRENSADSITFNLESHTAALPNTLTISRVLPLPRKGNAGTVKIFFNMRRSFLINVGLTTEKVVVAIAKLESSVPVGITDTDYRVLLLELLNGVTQTTEAEGEFTSAGRNRSILDTFILGLIPDEHGDPSV